MISLSKNPFYALILSILVILSTAEIINTDNSDFSILLAPPLPNFQETIKLANLQNIKFVQPDNAITYRGFTEIKVNDDESSNVEFFVSFSKYTSQCSHVACYYGWVDNFTASGEETVQGYPLGESEIHPVFQFKTNSKKDFIIKRHPQLHQFFVDIIEVGCELFEPTIKGVSRNIEPSNTADASQRQFFFKKQQQYEYAFIPEQTFSRFQPENTLKINPNELFAEDSINTDFSTASIRNLQTISKAFLNVDSIKLDKIPIRNVNINFDGPKVATLSKNIQISDLTTTKNDLKQRITVSRDYDVTSRQRQVDLNIPSSSFNGEQADFASRVKVKFDKQGDQQTSNYALKNLIDSFTNQKIILQVSAFSPQLIQARRADVNKIKFYDQAFQLKDISPVELVKPALQVAFLKDSAQTSALAPSIQTFASIKNPQIAQVSALNIAKLGSLIKIPKPQCILGSKNNEVIIYSYEKVLYQDTIFGKKFKISLKVDASFVNEKDIRFRGVIYYTLFGNTKSINAFNYVRDIRVNQSKPINFAGSWSFSIDIPLPPPVSFLSLKFSFGVSFKLDILLYAKGYPSSNSCSYKFDVGANFSTGLGVEASGSISAKVIQGGVFISGELVNLGSDPKLSSALDLLNKKLSVSMVWYFEIRAFKFEWGFFYRHIIIKIKWFSIQISWSDKKIIAKWPISNGIVKKFKIIDQSWVINL